MHVLYLLKNAMHFNFVVPNKLFNGKFLITNKICALPCIHVVDFSLYTFFQTQRADNKTGFE